MNEPVPGEPIVSQRGLSDRSRELLQNTRRTDAAAETKALPHRVIRSLWWPVLYFVLGLSVVDFIVVPLIWATRSGWSADGFAAACCGLTASQVFLIALGLVFGRESLAARLLISWLLLMVIFICWTAGYWSSVFTAEVDLGGQRWFTLAGMAWCVLVAVLAGCALPLMFARGVLAWRLTNPDEVRERQQRDPQAENRYTLRDLLVLMSMIGVTLGVPRFTYHPQAGRYDDAEFWMAIAGCAASAALLTSIALFLAWKLLRPYGDPQWAWGFLTWTTWLTLLLIGLCLAANLGSVLWLGLAYLVWSLALLDGAVLGLLVLQGHGWRWERTSQPLRVS